MWLKSTIQPVKMQNFFEYAIIVNTWIPSRLTVSLLLIVQKEKEEKCL